jgi:hypothetical protein
MNEQIKQTNRQGLHVEGSAQVRTGDILTGAQSAKSRRPRCIGVCATPSGISESFFVNRRGAEKLL